MSDAANTNRAEKRKPTISADDVQALRAVYAAQIAAAGRIEAAVKAGAICPLLGPSFRGRGALAVELAIRGLIPPAQATLEIAQAEFEAMGRKPLPPLDWDIQKVVDWDDAVREPPRPPEPPRWQHYKDRDDDFQRAEYEERLYGPDYVEFDEPEGADAA